MIRVNPNYSKIQANYLFAEVAQRVRAYQAENPSADLIRLGIGDVTRALPAACVAAMEKAAREMGADETFRGYGPDYGYAFLREAIAEGDFHARGCDVSPDEIFVSDGAKCDTGNFQEILDAAARVAVPDPVYPVYVDSNVMAGRTGPAADGRYAGLVYLEGSEANGYVPALPAEPVDVVYLCFPNNPTGAVASREQLASWVAWAKENGALILFDAAYEAFIRDPDVPHSIYEIPGAKEVAVEFRSFSKTAGFTGTRCGYCVVPNECRAFDAAGAAVPLQPLWKRRQSTKFNGVSYPVQRAAEAACSPEGRQREDRDRAPRGEGLPLHRRAQLALRVVRLRHGVVGVLRQAAARGERRHHAGRRLRPRRRGPYPHHRLQLPRERRARDGAPGPRPLGRPTR